MRVAVNLILCISVYASNTNAIVRNTAAPPNPGEIRLIAFNVFMPFWVAQPFHVYRQTSVGHNIDR